ncbi:MAG: ABC transporter ATP-binding protein [Gaiellaceae bacterium]
MALAAVERLAFSYPDSAAEALSGVSLSVEAGEVLLVLGRSGSGKSTLLRALAGLVPHFHGGRFAGRVVVAGRDTRRCSPAELAGTAATVFQDPEDQIVFGRVASEVAFGPENLGLAPAEIERRVSDALATVGASHLLERPVAELSGGELQRICLASALALEPRLLILDEPTSQLDPAAAASFLELIGRLARERGAAVVLSEQRPALPLEVCDRVLFLDRGRIAFDGPRSRALTWLAENAPAFLGQLGGPARRPAVGEPLCRLTDVGFSYRPDRPALGGAALTLRRGEVVALVGPNGAGKTTLAKIATGLLDAASGEVERKGRAAYLSQDPGRYVFCERAVDEVALGADRARAIASLARLGLSGYEQRHPRDLSSGERERLALAAVLAVEPDLLALDEPTRGVDPERKQELGRLLRADAARRATLVVTNDLAFARSLADRLVSLDAPGSLARA